MNALEFRGYDLTMLVIKYDLERAVNEKTENDFKFLTLPERIVVEQYTTDQNDVLECIRDLLLDEDSIEETALLVRRAKKHIIREYAGNSYLPGVIDELEKNFLTSISEHNGNDKSLFQLKEPVVKK